MTKYWSDSLSLQWSRQAIITVSLSTWMTTKINGVATDLFCTGVIGHLVGMVLNWGPKILIQNEWTGLQKKFEILSLGVQLRERKD